MNEPTYACEDWFSRHIFHFDTWLNEFKDCPHIRGLEVGSFEGRSARWLLENILTHETSGLVCVDPFSSNSMFSSDIKGVVSDPVYENFKHNVLSFGSRKVKHFRESSRTGLVRFEDDVFDFIYIDGSHFTKDVLMDAVLAWPLLKLGGTLIFDDYTWYGASEFEIPGKAINAFLSAMEGYVHVLHADVQLCCKKIKK